MAQLLPWWTVWTQGNFGGGYRAGGSIWRTSEHNFISATTTTKIIRKPREKNPLCSCFVCLFILNVWYTFQTSSKISLILPSTTGHGLTKLPSCCCCTEFRMSTLHIPSIRAQLACKGNFPRKIISQEILWTSCVWNKDVKDFFPVVPLTVQTVTEEMFPSFVKQLRSNVYSSSEVNASPKVSTFSRKVAFTLSSGKNVEGVRICCCCWKK